MKILYDHQIFTMQKYGGISRYFTQIISNLPIDVQTDIAVKYSNNVYIKNYDPSILNYSDKNFLSEIHFRGKQRILNFTQRLTNNLPPETINKNLSIELLKKQDFDIFHPTYYDDYFLEYIGNKPFVLTIHDMIHELYPEMLKNTDLVLKKAHLASRANHIIAVSEQTKKDIIDILNIKEEKISVIYHASSIQKDSKPNTLSLPPNYILYVGERSNYKNFIFFACAIKSLLIERKDLCVVCTGSCFSKEEQKLLSGLKVENRFLNLFIQEDQFYEVFHNAKVFIFPSYYEGFGIPIIEAFDCECPVVLSNSSCFPEIAGDSALYFEPKSKTQLISAVEKVLDKPDLSESLIKKGSKRLGLFSWPKSAEKTLEVYKNVLKGV